MAEKNKPLKLNRIRILKTGLFGVNRYLDMRQESNRALFERLASPGTELTLVRDRSDYYHPFKVDVYTSDGIKLGTVTETKCQTVARLMDAGLEVIAVVNESLPFHDSDHNYGLEDNGTDDGWSPASRVKTGYSECNLPYGIYLVC